MLSKSRTNIVGIVVSDMSNPFYPALIQKLSQGLQRIGLQSLLFNITRGSNIEEQLSALRRYNVDAVIVISATMLSGATLHWATEGRAAILINRVVEDADINCVCCDNVEGARAIADHFHALGRRRVAYVSGLSHTTTNLERQNAFITRVAELGMTLTGRVDGGEYSYEAGRRAALEIASKRQYRCDLLRQRHSRGRRHRCAAARIAASVCPRTFPSPASTTSPWRPGRITALTTFRQPLDEIVTVVVGMPEDGSRQPGQPSSVKRISGGLIVRQSTGPLG